MMADKLYKKVRKQLDENRLEHEVLSKSMMIFLVHVLYHSPH